MQNRHMSNAAKSMLPELLLGLVAIAVGLVITGFVVANAVGDCKRARDTIRVTGSAREPIDADLATRSLAVNAQAVRPQEAVRLLNRRVRAVRAFLSDGGLPTSAISEPPVVTEQTTILVAP